MEADREDKAYLDSGDLQNLLDDRAIKYNNPDFIPDDPLSVPHLFEGRENIEISGFLAASIAWGQRRTIVRNARELISRMNNDPYSFIMNMEEEDLEVFNGFVHRTFLDVDCKYFMRSLQNIYRNYGGIGEIVQDNYQQTGSVKSALIAFRKVFFELPALARTSKHVADPQMNSSAKRLNMYLRWMVRKDKQGVDFGHWDRIDQADLFIPLDVHTGTVARKLGLLRRKQNDWKSVEELTEKLRLFDSRDPVKYDFALFGLGAFEDY